MPSRDPEPPPDTELVNRARGGDLDAFAELVRLHEARVRAVLGRLLTDQRDVQEAAQDTFVRAWQSLDRYRGEAAPFTWLYRIAVNEALQRLRRKQLATRPLKHGSEPAVPDAHRDERASLLVTALRGLPPDLRVAVVLRDVEGWSSKEVADALGISLAAAKGRIHRGRMQLRADLERSASGDY